MASLYRSGHVVMIDLIPSTTPDAINDAVCSAFASLDSAMSGKVSMHRWRLLSKVSRSKGARALLKPHKVGGDVSFQDFEWYVLS
jgi:hypothetical protein